MISPQEEIFLLPEGADLAKSTLALLTATALHGVDLTGARVREQVAVVGLGLVGQLCARLLNYAGANVVATDLVALRRDVAQQAGITVVEPTPDLRDAFKGHFPHGAEAVLDATGSSRAMKSSLSLMRKKPRTDPCGSNALAASRAGMSSFEIQKIDSHQQNEWHGPRFIAQGSYGDPIEINYYDLFLDEVKFIVPRVHEMKDIYRALELMADRRFSLDGLLTKTVPWTEAPDIYTLLRERPNDLITACFRWD
jgi:threonine dehydrogenase-like Zn-dependent dehydrogenase